MADVLDWLETPDQSIMIVLSPGEDDLDRDERFERACQMFPEMKIEMDEAGNIVMTPGNSDDSSFRSGEAFRQLAEWSRKDGTGRAFEATANFNLPDGSKRQPDASWVPKTVLAQEGKAKLKSATKTRHVPVFLIEVTSPSDRLPEQQEKCRKWLRNGVQEALLVHPKTRTVYVFRPSAEMLTIADAISVESDVLTGFVLDCAPLWEDLF